MVTPGMASKGLGAVRRSTTKKFQDKRKNWKTYLAGAAIFVAILGRVLHLHYERHQLWQRLVNKYEVSAKKDRKLSPSEVASFLRDSGVNLTKEQFSSWVGSIDDENDGFDKSELVEAVEFFEDFESASGNLVTLGQGWLGLSIFGDTLLIMAAAAGILSVLSNGEDLERKIAANSFVSAVKMSRMQRKWQALEEQINSAESRREELEGQTEGVQRASQSAQEHAREYEEKLRAQLEKASATEESLRRFEEERVQIMEEARQAQERLEHHNKEISALKKSEAAALEELSRLRKETEQHMAEKHMSTAKLKAMNQCLRGINAVGAASPFKGAGLGKYSDSGATCGFAVQGAGGFGRSNSGLRPVISTHAGFRMERFVFGYPTEDNVEMYEVDRKRDLLGEGADCAYRCRNIATNEQLALKIYEMTRGTHRRQILSDLNAHQATQDHPHIVKYKAVIETQEQIFVLMELINGKDLFSDILDRGGLNEERSAAIMVQLLDALKFLHTSNIIHGDIKPENVMLEKPDSDEPNVKLIDFGFSCFMQGKLEDHQGLVSNLHAPVQDVYAPPEALTGSNGMTKEVDMFRLGCCLYVMLMATYPFDRSTRDLEARRKGEVLKYPKWKSLTSGAQDLITKLVRDRPPVEEVLKHPWIVSKGKS